MSEQVEKEDKTPTLVEEPPIEEQQEQELAPPPDAPTFELGDRVYIQGGRYNETRGRIYYMDDDLLRILPDGVSDRVVDIPIENDDFAEDLGIENFFLLSKRAAPAFVTQIDARVGQVADSFAGDGSLGIQYTIKEVGEAEDFLMLADDTGGELRVECAFRGIPRDLPFVVLRPRQGPILTEERNAAANAAAAIATEEAEEDFFEDIELQEEKEEEVFGLVERPAAMRTYPDRVQRDEMFRDILEALPLTAQRSPAEQRQTRQFVEQFILMRNSLVEYDSAGDPIGKITTSFQTIAELLEKGDIPLARPILDANRTLYLDSTGDDPIEVPGASINVQYLDKVLDESNDYLNTQLGGVSNMLQRRNNLPQWFATWDEFFEKFMRPWTSQGAAGETVSFKGDKEFIRGPIPDGESEGASGLPRPKGMETSTVKDVVTTSSIGNVVMPLQRGIGPRITRLKDKYPLQIIETGDEGVITNQLLFPLRVQRDLGLTRSGILTKDIAFSHAQSNTLLELFRKLGGISDEPTTGGILAIGPDGNTMGMISIEEWLQAQSLRIRGLGEALIEIKNLGLTQKELTTDQQAILVAKINQLRAIVKGHIAQERSDSEKAVAELRLENMPFLQSEALEELMALLVSEPQLQPRVEELKGMLPAYKENDIALVGGVCAQMSDLFLTTMAGVPGPLARERNRRAREIFLETLRQTLLKVVRRENAGQEPQPIRCSHTQSLEKIRRVRSADDRMKLFAKFLARYQGPRKDNWVICSASPRDAPHHLICYHEVLLLQEYLHPREKDTIHKELLLAFSGGIFHGRYICKNCGQSISQLDFDTSVEFDDEGRPMSGRAVLVDKDEIESEEFRLLLGAPTEKVTEKEYADETHETIHKSCRHLFDVLGIYAEKEAYARVVERVNSEVLRLPSREDYAKLLKVREKAAAATGKSEGKQLDYDVYLSRVLVCSVATHVLIEIQTHVPDFVVRAKIPNCVAGFSGYPLGKEADKTGINYVSCAVSSIKVNDAPWNMTGFNLQPSEKKRQEIIAASIVKMGAEALKTASVQQLISLKRGYYEKLYGKSTIGLTETIIPRFRPTPYYITPEEATQAIVVPEAATSVDIARAWIQSAHRVARENGTFVRGSPFSETSSCFTNIQDPRGFWKIKEAAMPVLPSKDPPRGQAATQVTLHFTPRKMARLSIDPPEELFYRVFLRVCYDGPRKGLPHEPSYTHKCIHCGFLFPEDPYTESPAPPLVKDLFKEWQSEMDGIILKGKSALESQKVAVTKETFQDILDTTHTRFHVKYTEAERPLTGTILLERLARIEPTPFEEWRPLLLDTIAKAAQMPPNADSMTVAETYGQMSDFLESTLVDMERRIGEASMQSLRSILKQSPSQIVESVRTYFLVTFQRLLVGFNQDSLRVPGAYKLPVPTQDDVNAALKDHLSYLSALKKHVKGYTQIKLEQAKRQLSAVLPILQNEVRANLIPGGERGLSFLVGSLVIGIMAEFINPNRVPSGLVEQGGAFEPTARVPLTILEVCLSRLNLEGLNLSEEAIRDMIARRNDAEKITFINRLDRLTPEEKKVELMKKRLGLGEWAVGGTKAIFALDPDQYEREREQRIEMGLGDFVTDADAVANARALLADDADGGGGAGAEGGYTVDQMAADDF